MAKNDIVLVDAIVDQRVRDHLPSNVRSEVFEYFVLDQVLKDHDLSRDEIEFGWIDGRDDGGFDGFYVFVNGHLVDEPKDFSWPRSNALIEVWLVTCKHHATFKQATLDTIAASVQELFDLSLENSDLKGAYSEDLLEMRRIFAAAYRRLSITGAQLRFHIVYGSRGESTEVGDSVAARGKQVCATLTNLFSSCKSEMVYVGAGELVALHRKAKTFALEMPFVEHFATERNSYVLLVRVEDYWRFVTDDSGALRRYLFDSNVRDFLGAHGVNEDIAQSLQDEAAPDFWWLNNGVTILASSATVPGKTIQLQDIQIVNGLQTTETIYRHFNTGHATSKYRAVLVKVIVSTDDAVRDRIIRATNNQTPVELAALYATDKVQRDIEDVLERHDWYYERRRNYYRNIGKPQSHFITPLYLASAYTALIIKHPSLAAKLKPKFMRTRQGYESIFSPNVPIAVWPVLASVMKVVEKGLSKMPQPQKKGERFLRNWRGLISLIVVARRLGTFEYTTSQFIGLLDRGPIEQHEVEDAWDIIPSSQILFEKRKPKGSHAQVCCEAAAARFALDGVEVIGRRGLGSASQNASYAKLPSPELLDAVDALLPPQPWKPGVHREVANTLNRNAQEVSAAIQRLIALCRRHQQRDGVVYGPDGEIIAVDPERVDRPLIDSGTGGSARLGSSDV